MVMRLGKPVLCCAMSLMLNLPIAHAQAVKQSGAADQALRKAQGMLRQLTQEKATLEAEKTAALEQVGKLENVIRQLEPLQGEIERYRAGVESLERVSSSLQGQLVSAKDREQKLLQQQKSIIAQARQIQSDNQLLVAAVKERERWIAECSTKNTQLIEANLELVEKYKAKGFWQKVGELEPFTGIATVDTENAVESYQFKLEDLTVTEFQETQNSEEGTEEAVADE